MRSYGCPSWSKKRGCPPGRQAVVAQHKMSKLKSSEDIILGVGQHRERTEVVERLVITSKYVENNKSQVFYCHRRELHIKGVTYEGRKLGEFHDGLELEVLVLSHGFQHGWVYVYLALSTERELRSINTLKTITTLVLISWFPNIILH